MDSFGLPVEGTETRVNAGSEANEWMCQHIDACELVSRPENVCGWYHSHPGYDCWLSGIDVSTQTLYQKVSEPFIAIVIDPKRTMSAGKVEIGCYRTFPEGYVDPSRKEGKSASGMIPLEKQKDFGLHADRYYQLEHSFFKSKLDSSILEILWNEYWIQTLSSSPLLNNSDYLTNAISNIAVKTDLLVKGGISGGNNRSNKPFQKKFGGGGGGQDEGGISAEKIAQIEKESCKCALEMNHGLMVEALKNFMFTNTNNTKAV